MPENHNQRPNQSAESPVHYYSTIILELIKAVQAGPVRDGLPQPNLQSIRRHRCRRLRSQTCYFGSPGIGRFKRFGILADRNKIIAV